MTEREAIVAWIWYLVPVPPYVLIWWLFGHGYAIAAALGFITAAIFAMWEVGRSRGDHLTPERNSDG